MPATAKTTKATKTIQAKNSSHAPNEANSTSAEPSAASNALTIAAQHLGPEQQLFNQLLEKIEKQSTDLQRLKTLADAHASERGAKLAPLRRQIAELQEQLLVYLDQRLQAPKGLRQRALADVEDMVGVLLDELLSAGEPSAQLAAIAKRYEIDDDDMLDGIDEEAASELHRAMAQAMGVEMDGDGSQSADDMIEAMMRKMQADDDAAMQAHEARQAKRKKTSKQKQAEQEELDAHGALRTIYRKLASALHPDRETDPAERIRKTQLMVSVNAANDRKDLLALLRLQMQVDQINPASVAAMADDKLRGFNRMLKSQLKDLQAEYQGTLARVQMAFGVGYGGISEKNFDSSLRQETQHLQNMVLWLKKDVVEIQDDKVLKKWAKQQLSMMDSADGY
jgi:hypothetical protein